ncbi:hypothetical protein FACS189446_8740 [Bacteroidia bacterium]|nr:hypothetical protein FACS189446_8740 [Bacteroidia bacterium]
MIIQISFAQSKKIPVLWNGYVLAKEIKFLKIETYNDIFYDELGLCDSTGIFHIINEPNALGVDTLRTDSIEYRLCGKIEAESPKSSRIYTYLYYRLNNQRDEDQGPSCNVLEENGSLKEIIKQHARTKYKYLIEQTKRQDPQETIVDSTKYDTINKPGASFPENSSNSLKEKNGSRFLIMPGIAFENAPVYSLMSGYIFKDKLGVYVKPKSNFLSKGKYEKGGKDNAFFNTKTTPNVERFSILGGVIWRLDKQWLLYAGGGYGSRWEQWETISSQRIEIKEFSFSGFEPEVGAIFEYKKWLIGGGVSCLKMEKRTLEWNLSVCYNLQLK